MSEASTLGARAARVALILGIVLVVVGGFVGLASQPVTDFAYIAGQEPSEFPTRMVGGLMLGAGVALAAAVGGFLLGRRR